MSATETLARPSSPASSTFDVESIRRDFPILHKPVRELVRRQMFRSMP